MSENNKFVKIIIKDFLRASEIGKEDLTLWGRSIENWNKYCFNLRNEKLVELLYLFRNSFWHTGTDKERQKFIGLRKKLTSYLREVKS